MQVATEEKVVLAFDICSSTFILEELNRTGSLAQYLKLLDEATSALLDDSGLFGFELYKFLGDGYILFFNPERPIDHVLVFAIRLANRMRDTITSFAKKYLESETIPRVGITIGIDQGAVVAVKVPYKKDLEFVGRPINVACRLQSSLTLPEQANKALLTVKVHSRIQSPELKIACSETTRTLRNINNDRKLRYYEFDPLLFGDKDYTRFREPIKNFMKSKTAKDQMMIQKLQRIKVEATSTTPSLGIMNIFDVEK